MAQTPPPDVRRSWLPFWITVAILFCGLGGPLTLMLVLPFGMASDNCHDGSRGYLCNGGDPLFAMLPVIGLFAALVAAPLAAWVISRIRLGGRRMSPTWGIGVGVIVWFLVPVIVWRIAESGYHGP
ncbi:hypothetical protein [Nocardia pseudobrasiliensis]|uniref:Uncharacterized protein n=1 Tax=Nocardia pseudobrasiliensis TaxID=45979 RepID=A0A370I8F2_9NOCA|nr:hypothetical protein [Nocardia pseudobrasiliensis]RDI67003.1 hypothetical protein DFR76_10374 [Nocardia pseudobrasiliensis]